MDAHADKMAAATTKIDACTADATKAAALAEYTVAFEAFHDAYEIEAAAAGSELAEAEAEAQAAESEVAGLEEPAAGDSTLKDLAKYVTFRTQKSAVVAELTALHEALTSVSDGKGDKITGDWLGSETLARLDEARSELAARVNAAREASEGVEERGVGAALANLQELHQAVEQAADHAAQAAAAQSSGAGNTTAESKEELDTERARLLTWCRQQKTNLDAMTDPEHIQEFCSSLLANYPAMEENFQVLLQIAAPLLHDDVIQKQLLESNEVWLNLQIGAYEKIRHTLVEIHPKSKLEDEVREFSTYSSRIQEFLESFADLLAGPIDADSESYIRPVLDQCELLRADFGAHQGLPKELTQFALRMECLRECYLNLRRAVLARLTFLTSTVPALTASMRRKEEYVARMKELKGWVDVKAQGETWGDIHERIMSIKQLIETEQSALQETSA